MMAKESSILTYRRLIIADTVMVCSRCAPPESNTSRGHQEEIWGPGQTRPRVFKFSNRLSRHARNGADAFYFRWCGYDSCQNPQYEPDRRYADASAVWMVGNGFGNSAQAVLSVNASASSSRHSSRRFRMAASFIC